MGKAEFREAKTQMGLQQECPLLPLFPISHLWQLEKTPEQSGLCFALSYLEGGIRAMQSLPGLMYIDDIVLFANNAGGACAGHLFF